MLWVKSLHLIFVNLVVRGPLLSAAPVRQPRARSESRCPTRALLLMARKLFRFTTILAVAGPCCSACGCSSATAIGLRGPGNGWMHAKARLRRARDRLSPTRCGSMLRKFERGVNKRSEKFFRVFNESAVLFACGDRDPRDRQAVLMR